MMVCIEVGTVTSGCARESTMSIRLVDVTVLVVNQEHLRSGVYDLRLSIRDSRSVGEECATGRPIVNA